MRTPTRPHRSPTNSEQHAPEEPHARSSRDRSARPLTRHIAPVRARLRAPAEDTFVILNIALLLVCIALLVYLVYALLRPEKF